MTDYCMYIVLYTDALFDDAVRISDYIVSNVSMITEQGIGKDVYVGGYDKICGSFSVFS